MILIAGVGFFEQLIAPQFFALELDLIPPELAGTGAGFLEAGGHLGSMCAMFLFGVIVDLFSSYRPAFMTLSVVAATGLVTVFCIRGRK